MTSDDASSVDIKLRSLSPFNAITIKGGESGDMAPMNTSVTPGQRLSQCKKKYPSSFSTYFTPVVHANDDPLCWNLKLWGNFDFFTFLF